MLERAMGEASAANMVLCCSHAVNRACGAPADPLGSTLLLAGHLCLQNRSTIRLSEGEKQNSWASINKSHHP